MNSLKQFIDRISNVERSGQQSVVIPLAEARTIRDDLTKLLLSFSEKRNDDVIKVELTGGRW